MLDSKDIITQKPNYLIFLFHGYCQDRNFMLRKFSNFSSIFPKAAIIAINAPYKCKENDSYYDWLRFEGEWNEENILRQLEITSIIINSFIEKKLAEYSLTSKQAILIGFSQGTRVALHIGLKYHQAFAGILGYGGCLTKPKSIDIISKPKICLIHGQEDDIITPSKHIETVSALKEANIEISSYLIPNLAHKINKQALDLGTEFIQAIMDK